LDFNKNVIFKSGSTAIFQSGRYYGELVGEMTESTNNTCGENEAAAGDTDSTNYSYTCNLCSQL
jgi:hypothetical protein